MQYFWYTKKQYLGISWANTLADQSDSLYLFKNVSSLSGHMDSLKTYSSYRNLPGSKQAWPQSPIRAATVLYQASRTQCFNSRGTSSPCYKSINCKNGLETVILKVEELHRVALGLLGRHYRVVVTFLRSKKKEADFTDKFELFWLNW